MNDAQALMAEIARVAPTKAHRLSRSMVDGSRTLTAEQARMVLDHLAKCDDIPGARQAVTVTVVTRRYPQDRPQDRAQRRPQDQPQERSPLPGIRAFSDIPAGYYATVSTTGTNDLDFWRVRKGKAGQWKGVSFAERVLGGGDGGGKPRTVDLDNIHQRLALQAIQEAGTDEAKQLFSDHIGHCNECGLPLTDELSRRLGKGPTCREKKAGGR